MRQSNIAKTSAAGITSAVVGVVVHFSVAHSSPLANPLVSAGLVFGLTTVLRLLGATAKLQREAEAERSYREELEGLLDETSKLAPRLARLEDKPFWGDYFRGELKALSASLKDAADDEKAMLYPGPRVRALVLEGMSDESIRMVHFLADTNVWTNRYWRSFFRRIGKWLEGAPPERSVKRLFLYKDRAELLDPRIRAMLIFHSTTRGFSCRLLDGGTYEEDKKSGHPPFVKGVHDFGLYGPTMVWYWTGSVNNESVSYLTTSSDQVSLFDCWFEHCWERAKSPLDTTQFPELAIGGEETPLSVDELLDVLAGTASPPMPLEVVAGSEAIYQQAADIARASTGKLRATHIRPRADSRLPAPPNPIQDRDLRRTYNSMLGEHLRQGSVLFYRTIFFDGEAGDPERELIRNDLEAIGCAQLGDLATVTRADKNPISVDVLIGDAAALLSFPTLRTDGSLRFGLVVKEPETLRYLVDWWDQYCAHRSTWERLTDPADF